MSTKYFNDSGEMFRYVKDPSFCPYCENGHITAQSNIEDHFDFGTRTISCDACKKEWTEVYHLIAIEEIQ